jgi:hypothetical protein
MKKAFRRPLGIFLILLAIVTGPVPIVQGWVFFVAAIGVLGKDDPIIQFCFRQIRKVAWGRAALDKLGIKEAPDPPQGSAT